VRRFVWLLIGALAMPARADETLPSPLRINDVVSLARSRRAEITAAKARARAAAQRPAIVSALDDPSVSFSLDHVPFNGMGADYSVTFQQSFPLSRVRGNRKRRAEANLRRELAEVDRAALDVELDAAQAFWMLAEARATAEIVANQKALADQLVNAATARYAATTGTQSDVLRAQIEVSRLDAEQRATAAEVRAAEVMLNTSLSRAADAQVPDLDARVSDLVPPAPDAIVHAAEQRPELRAGRAEIDEAEAEIRVMRSMYGADLAKRIALPMWGGLVSLTVLTLFVVPAVYVVWRSFHLRHAPRPRVGHLANGAR
jgi:outer membrane protein TolC